VVYQPGGAIAAKMAFETWKNSTQMAQFVVLVLFTPLGIAVTALRFVATRRSARKPGAEDWLAVIAAVFCTLMNWAALMGKLGRLCYPLHNLC
jgi:cytochrome bd-type quinol oxidase subunit 2